MKQNERALGIWVDVTGLGLPLLMMLAYVLRWSPVVQLVLMAVFFAAILGTRIVLTHRSGRRTRA